jgi:hypothetical protein
MLRPVLSMGPQPLMTERHRGNRSHDELFVDYSSSESEKNYRQSFVCDYLQLINTGRFISVRGNGSSGDNKNDRLTQICNIRI